MYIYLKASYLIQKRKEEEEEASHKSSERPNFK